MLDVSHDAIRRYSAVFAENYSHFIRQTPLWKLPGKALGVDCAEVWLKLEHLQTGGSFKARGMLNRLLSNPIPASGVVIASGGNAGIAALAAAKELKVRCEVFLPEVSSLAKRAKLAALHSGAYKPCADEKVCLIICGANLDPATLA